MYMSVLAACMSVRLVMCLLPVEDDARLPETGVRKSHHVRARTQT